jgi:hypothetical protein
MTLAPRSLSALLMLVCFLIFYRLMGNHLGLLADVVSGFKSLSDAPCLVWKCGTRRSDSHVSGQTWATISNCVNSLL